VRQQSNDGGFSLYHVESPVFPVLLSVPHAGREYPAELLDKLRVAPDELIRLEDRYSDRLIQHAISAGISAIVAHRARGWIDLNRAENDVDREMIKDAGHMQFEPSAKTRGGLGLIPRRLSGCGDLWSKPLDAADLSARISNDYRPYHDAIEQCLCAMHTKFGVAILLDIHSMPPLQKHHSGISVQLVIGDSFGKSAATRYSDAVMAIAQHHGLEAALNHPYPGDYMLRRHGNPRKNIHALQLEVDRSLYLDELLREPSLSLAKIAAMITEIAFAVSEQSGWNLAVAAE
jgi:N-formylglutamate amidohydrolase